MPKNYFTNENPKTVINTSGSYGIVHGGIDTTEIVDGIKERGAGLGKLASSMPSPMARLFLFSAALREVNSQEAGRPGEGHDGVINDDGNMVPTPYHDLVGELLDMLEFIYKYGDEPDFHVVCWNLGVETYALDNSGIKAHKNLASALRSAFSYGVLNGNNDIYLFKWKDKVIGGSSPVTLVYTSVNLRENLESLGVTFTGNAGNKLFADEAIPLHLRDSAFREYMYRLLYTGELPQQADGTPLSLLSKYILDSATNYDVYLQNTVRKHPGQFGRVVDLKSQGNIVKIGNVQMRVANGEIVIDATTTDYLLKPSVNYYQRGNAQTKVPMVLTNQGVDGLTYAEKRPWKRGSDIIPPVLEQDINSRKLPGFQRKTKYPFLTVDDFLESKIIEVSYVLNGKDFVSGINKDTSFLLPLKKTFFEYFTLRDLVDDHGQSTGMLIVDVDEEREIVTVDLHIPLQSGNTITLHRRYSTKEGSTEKLDCYDSAQTFDFAVFPFYRLEPNTDKNVYNVLLGSTVKGVSMNFYEPDVNAGLKLQKSEVSNRSRLGVNKSAANTDHILVEGPFTVAEISVKNSTTEDEVKALIIPRFKIIDTAPAQITSNFIFGVDFGTTNTHISYTNVPQGMPIALANIHTFDYSTETDDSQMAMFNKERSFGEFGAFATAVKRELVPTAIGGDSPYKFPMRTATYQIAGRPTNLKMFSNTNIGFNYSEDISGSKDYRTNLKWERTDTLAVPRLKSYFSQILWMLKNKSVLNGGSDAFTLIVTYPIAMRESDKATFDETWKNAAKEVRCAVDIRKRTESVAPYYSYLAKLGYGEPYLNVDIGGGTTDILYVNPLTGESNVFSAFFAANDLWNDGLDPVNQPAKANGFVTFYEKREENSRGVNFLNDIKLNANSSADVISYLFSTDNTYRLSDVIRSSSHMMQLPIIHFSALMFYVAYSLHMAEVDIPTSLSFTGMGSKYIKLLSDDVHSIERLANALFHFAGDTLDNPELKNAAIKLHFAPNPKEVTANGALISLNYAGALNPSEDTYLGYEGEDPSKTFRYNNITPDVQEAVMRLFNKFTQAFNNEEMQDVMSDLGYGVDDATIAKLEKFSRASMLRAKESSMSKQTSSAKLKEPMFFWPLKESLYQLGREMAQEAIANLTNGQ